MGTFVFYGFPRRFDRDPDRRHAHPYAHPTTRLSLCYLHAFDTGYALCSYTSPSSDRRRLY